MGSKLHTAYSALLLALIVFTQLDGSPVWVESTQVQIIKVHGTECGPTAKSVIRVQATTLCIKETPDVVKNKIEGAR